MQKCPNCGNSVQALLPIDAGMKTALKTAFPNMIVPEQVCANCVENLVGRVSKGAKLRVEQKAREQNRVMLWKSRVNLIKQARNNMLQKAFSEAAVNYEKYLRVLEIVYDCKPGTLHPQIFGNSQRSKELTIVTTVYWDLLRIYDQSSAYSDRMKRVGDKLAEFLPNSALYPDIVKKAELFVKTAKNPDVVRGFLKKSRGKKGFCFIATATYDDPTAPELHQLRVFRDQILRPSWAGRQFIYFYYKSSPPVAQWLRRSPRARQLMRKTLSFIASQLKNSP